MVSKQTITINGRHYDTHTGLPVDAPADEASSSRDQAGTLAKGIHTSIQKSHTLNRKVVQKESQVASIISRPAGPKHMDIARNASISRFAPRPVVSPPVAESDMIGHVAHPMVKKAHQSVASKKQSSQQAHVASKVLKNEAIEKALSTPAKKHPKPAAKQRFPRIFSVGSAGLAVLLLAGYLTYLNMPAVSIRVAAVQSGINATYPDYRPSGYRLDGPIAYSDGKVSMRFAANTGPQSFTVTQQRSNLNSSAVLESIVEPEASSDPSILTKSGLTVYMFNGKAAWVNGGILYTVDGNAPLSNDQILRIATSL